MHRVRVRASVVIATLILFSAAVTAWASTTRVTSPVPVSMAAIKTTRMVVRPRPLNHHWWGYWSVPPRKHVGVQPIRAQRRSRQQVHTGHHELGGRGQVATVRGGSVYESGQASYYSGGSGACGPLVGLYAAHKTLPCGTKVRVSNGRSSVVVTILDRGPFVPGRVIDLSPEAFGQLAPMSAGVTSVSLYRL